MSLLNDSANRPDVIANITAEVGVTLLAVSTMAKWDFSVMRDTVLELKMDKPETEGTQKLKISNIGTNGTGVFYVGVGAGKAPNFEQLVNCRDSKNDSLQGCKRVFLTQS